MKIWFSEEALRLYDQATRFAEANLLNTSSKPGFDAEAWRAINNFGAFHYGVARDGDSLTKSATLAVALFQGLGRGGADRGLLFSAGAHLFGCLVALTMHGSLSQRDRWEALLRSGDVIAALAVTEPQGGSSLDKISTAAIRKDDGYYLTGRKTLVSNAPIAGVFIVIAKEFPDRGPLGYTVFLVPSDAEGLMISPIAPTIGFQGASMGEMTLDNCFVPASEVLGRSGAGMRIFATAMLWERSCLLSGLLGAAERDLMNCISKLRSSGREEIVLSRQAVSHRLARMHARWHAASLVAHNAASMLDRGHEDMETASLAKLAVSEMLIENAQDGLRVMAGMGWRKEAPDFAAALNDALGGLFASGTSEIQLEILARNLMIQSRGQ